MPRPQLLNLNFPILLFLACSNLVVTGATLTLNNTVLRKSPEVIAYNLAHYFPGSNMTGWWEYSGVSGARIFLSASHFEVSAAERPGDALVVDRESFLQRRAALSANPLDTEIINWEAIEGRFNSTLNSNNKIVPQYALSELHSLGIDILAQMTVSEGSFPIADENDWNGKWILWRTYFAAAFWLAKEFDVERYTSHNEPNHPASRIEPGPWLMRLRLASDAAREAIAAVNRLYGKSLDLKFTAPITAGNGANVFNEYGRPVVEGMETNFLGETRPGFRLIETYAYQSYISDPQTHVDRYNENVGYVANALPNGADPLKFAITEFNVHTGATYDAMPESSDSLSKAVRFGGIATKLALSGMDELYAFKFAMTPASGNFPVQKNGMGFIDNDAAPYNFAGFSRSGEVYRLFNKALKPGWEILNVSPSGIPATYHHLATRDPSTGTIHLFLCNEGGSSVPLEIDLTALGIPEGNIALIEDVSSWRTGITRSREIVSQGSLSPGSQPGNSVWLIRIPGNKVLSLRETGSTRMIEIEADAMVVDGTHRDTNYGTAAEALTRNDPDSRDQRAAVLLKFPPIPQSNRNRLELAILAIPVSSTNDVRDIEANLYGLEDTTWEEDTITWATTHNLKQNVPAGNEIHNSAMEGLGIDAKMLGKITAPASATTRYIDVTDYLRSQNGAASAFLLLQEPRWDIDIRVSEVPQDWSELPRGDTQPAGVRYYPKENTDGVAPAQLILYESVTPLEYTAWSTITIADPNLRGMEEITGPLGISNLLQFALGIDSVTATADALPEMRIEEDGVLNFHYTLNPEITGVSSELFSSEDLENWSPISEQPQALYDGFRITYKHMVDTANLPRFFRFVVTHSNP